MYSVKLRKHGNKQYIEKWRKDFRLDDEDILVPEMPDDTEDKYPYYYYSMGAWVFDQKTYQKDMKDKADKQKEEEEEKKKEQDKTISMDDVMQALLDLAIEVELIKEQLTMLLGDVEED